MALITELEGIKHPMFGAAVLSGLLMFAPGISYLYFFEKWTILNLDILKILSLSLAIIAPFFIFNTIFIAIFVQRAENENKARSESKHVETTPILFITLLISLFLSAAILYIGLLITYFSGGNPHSALIQDILLQTSVFFIYIISFFLSYRIKPIKQRK